MSLIVVTTPSGSVQLTTANVSKAITVTQGVSLWDSDGVDHVKPKAGKKVNAAYLELSGKVDVVSGKGLSTEDYTTAEKEKLAGLPDGTDLTTALGEKLVGNTEITGATKTKITYDAKGLVTSGADATTADIADSADKRYCTDAQKTSLADAIAVNGIVQCNGSGDFSQYKLPKAIALYKDGALTVDTKLCSIISPFAMTVTEIRVAVDTAPTGANLIVDVNKNGTTMYTTQGNRPTIVATNTSATATDPDVTSIAVGDIISIDVDQIGSTVAGENLMVTIICEV